MLFGDAALSAGSLVLFEERRGQAGGRPGAGGVHHVAFGVEDEVAQLRWKRWLSDHGVPVSGPFNRGWFRSIYFTDPDGQILEIATRGPGYAVDEDATSLGSRVVVPPGAELRGERDEGAIRQRVWEEPVAEIDESMVLTGIHHISNITDDVADMDAFLTPSLGLRLVKRSVNQDDASMPHWFWANYDGRQVAPRSSLTMFGPWPAGGFPVYGTMKRAVAGVGQAASIAFSASERPPAVALDGRGADIAPSSDVLGGWQDHLAGLGIESDITDAGAWRVLGFDAPDGMRYEIVQS